VWSREESLGLVINVAPSELYELMGESTKSSFHFLICQNGRNHSYFTIFFYLKIQINKIKGR
jgi:hypothetical protein